MSASARRLLLPGKGEYYFRLLMQELNASAETFEQIARVVYDCQRRHPDLAASFLRGSAGTDTLNSHTPISVASASHRLWDTQASSGAESAALVADTPVSPPSIRPSSKRDVCMEMVRPANAKLQPFGTGTYYFQRFGASVGIPAMRRVDFDPKRLRADFPIFKEKVNGKPLIWLDNAATSQKPHAVIDAIAYFYRHLNSNIHRSAHALAARATEVYEEARSTVQRFLGASAPEEIIFVRGTTEAINLVAGSYGQQMVGNGDEILLTQMEHHSNIVPWQLLTEKTGAVLKVAPIDNHGALILEEFERLLGSRTKLVAVTHVSNVLGTVNPVRQLAELAHRYGARILVDGAQSAPHFPVDMQDLDCDFYAFSGHKLFGPTGIGVLYAKRELLKTMPPWQGGGNMIRQVTFEKTTYNDPPAKFEAGTAILAGAYGLAKAIEYLDGVGLEIVHEHEQKLLDRATRLLSAIPGVRLIGVAPQKVSVVSFIVDDIVPERLGEILDAEGIAVRVGHHCAQPTLSRYGITSTIRLSLAFYNTVEEVETMAAVVRNGIRTLR